MKDGLTSNERESTETGESGDVDLEGMKTLAELEDGIEPVAEGTLTLHLVQHHAIAEGHLGVVDACPVRQSQHKKLQ